jgi:hypothetical protein
VSATAIPPATTTSGPGTCGTSRRSTSSRPIPPAETATVAAFASGSFDTASATLEKKPSASGSAETPSKFGSWLAATVSPTPILMPVSVAG